MSTTQFCLRLAAIAFGCLHGVTSLAGALPEERADLSWHMNDGGGVKEQGPLLFVRKNATDDLSINAGYQVDQISGVSAELFAFAAPLHDERKQKSLGVDYLYGKTSYSANVNSSAKSDYDSRAVSFDISQDMFGDLTTVNFGVSKGWDSVYRAIGPGVSRDPTFHERIDRRTWTLGVSQVLTRNLIARYVQDVSTESGYLQNPYHAIRYLSGSAYGIAPEIAPGTRTSTAIALKLKYYLPWRGAVSAQYRYFYDTWKVSGSTTELAYSQPLRHDAVVVDFTYRHYQQGHASFYSDMFSAPNQQNYMARERMLAAQTNDAIGLAVSFDLYKSKHRFLHKLSGAVHYDYAMYKLKDFRDTSLQGFAMGNEPLYDYNANVVQATLTAWF